MQTYFLFDDHSLISFRINKQIIFFLCTVNVTIAEGKVFRTLAIPRLACARIILRQPKTMEWLADSFVPRKSVIYSVIFFNWSSCFYLDGQ